MSLVIEFIGYPGSGKTVVSKKLKKFLHNKKFKLVKADKFFFDYHASGFINKLILKNYYNYKKNVKFESRIIFKNQHTYLRKKLSEIIKKNKLKKSIENFKKLLNLTDLNQLAKKRAIDNFKIDLCTFFLSKKKDFYIYNDEGIVQKVYQLYKKDLKIRKIEKEINRYLEALPLPNILISMNTNFDKSVKNSIKRNRGFKYNFENISKTQKIFEKIDFIIKQKIMKKTKSIIIKNNKQIDKQFKNIQKLL